MAAANVMGSGGGAVGADVLGRQGVGARLAIRARADFGRAMAAAFAGGTDVHDRDGVFAYIERMGGEPPGPGRSLFMDLYAAQARANMQRELASQSV